jgi:hypothetical protein
MKFLKKLMILLAAISVGTGCQPESGTVNADDAQYPRSSIEWKSVQNPNNPFNYIGVAHNDLLDYVGTVCTAEQLENDFAAVIDAAINFVGDSSWYDPYVTAQWVSSSIDSLPYFWSLHTSSCGAEEIGYINAILAELNDTTYAFGEYGIDTTLVDRLSNVEDQILGSGLSDSAMQVPLVFVAVAKHSAAYWNSVAMAVADGVQSSGRLSKAYTRPGPFMVLFHCVVKSVKEIAAVDAKAAATAAAPAAGVVAVRLIPPRAGAAAVVVYSGTRSIQSVVGE